MSSLGVATSVLQKAAVGDRGAVDRLMVIVYDEMRRQARDWLRRQWRVPTLTPTELVHKAYLKLVDIERVDWRGRTHFRAVGARVMWRLLIEHARRKRALKRGGDRVRITLVDTIARDDLDLPLVDLTEALERLAELEPLHHEILKLRFFGGLGVREVSESLGIGRRTVERNTRAALAWLRSRLR